MIRTQKLTVEGVCDTYVHREHSFDSQSHVAWSIMLICPRCQHPWAVLKFLEDQDVWPEAAYCEFCGIKDDWHPVPGSVLVEEGWGVIDDSLLGALPENVLRREFNLHLRAYSGEGMT